MLYIRTMRKIFIHTVILIGLASCKKTTHYCYDQIVDAQGNVVASTTGKTRKHFRDKAEVLQYQQDNSKVCIEQH